MRLDRYILVPLAVAALCLVSCKEAEYTPGDESNYLGINVYFEEVSPSYSLPLDEYSMTFHLERDDAPRQDEYVPLHYSCSHPEAFDIPESVFFAQGEMSADVTIFFTDKMRNFEQYRLVLYVDESCTQQYISQTTYPRIETTIVKEDYQTVNRGRYTCGGAVLHVIDWGNGIYSRMVDLEYSNTLDAYRLDPWGHGNYLKFSITEDRDEQRQSILALDARTYLTGDTYTTSDGEEVNVTASVAGTATYSSSRRTYTFPFSYGYQGNSAGTYQDTFSY